MRRCPAVLLLVLLAASGVDAQVRYGAKAGATFATVDTDFPDYTLRVGIAAGAFVEWLIGSRLALEPEVLFNQKGTKIDSDLLEASFRIDYLEVPILARYNLTAGPRPFFVFGGPAIAFKLHAQSSATFGGQTVKDDVSDTVEDLDWGVAVGAGKEFIRFFVEGRYTHGMKNTDLDGGTSKNRAITALAGVRF